MNVLLWAPYGAGEHYWGPGISAYRLYKTGLPNGVKVYLAHGFRDQKEYPEVFEDQFFIPELVRGQRLSEVKFLWNANKWIDKNFHKFDVVHVLGLYEKSFRPAIWFEKKGVPVFCKITSIGEGLNEQSLISKLLGLGRYRKNNISHITGFIAISDEIGKSLENYGINKNKIHKIPNGVDTELFHPVSNKIKKELRKKLNFRSELTILFVGGITRRKQPLLLAKAVSEVVKEGLNVQLVLLGPVRDETEMGQINQLIKNEQLNNEIIHIGYSNSPEVYYQSADIFCLPSKREGMSNALLEAMACGLPCLVTPISGSKDLICDEVNGSFIDSMESLKKKLKKYYLEKKTISKYSKNNVKKIKENYSVKLLIDKHVKLFSDIK